MPVTVHVPTPLRKLTDSKAEVEVEAGSVAELVTNMDGSYSGIGEKLLDENGSIRRYVNLYVNDEDIRFLEGMDTQLKDGDSISIVPAIAGGA
ncbi:MAG: MoaD/ThiS family protein [Gemmatimonadetes bacterium]|nr:MoaD/ThiS family protein [Gemmatimonadota bacterium]